MFALKIQHTKIEYIFLIKLLTNKSYQNYLSYFNWQALIGEFILMTTIQYDPSGFNVSILHCICSWLSECCHLGLFWITLKQTFLKENVLIEQRLFPRSQHFNDYKTTWRNNILTSVHHFSTFNNLWRLLIFINLLVPGVGVSCDFSQRSCISRY